MSEMHAKDQDRPTRRDFLRTSAAGGLGLLALSTFSGCANEAPVEHRSECELFDGRVKCCKELETQYQWDVGGANVPVEIVMKLYFSEPGKYRFEFWKSNYRARDSKVDAYEFDIAPQDVASSPEGVFRVRREMLRDFYRMEAVFVDADGGLHSDSHSGFVYNGWSWSDVHPRGEY